LADFGMPLAQVTFRGKVWTT